MSIVAEELEIFILTYNRADMLKVAIQSCLDQTIKEISITVLDNASTDHTSEIASSQSWAKGNAEAGEFKHRVEQGKGTGVCGP